jgi:hypothetical protein
MDFGTRHAASGEPAAAPAVATECRLTACSNCGQTAACATTTSSEAIDAATANTDRNDYFMGPAKPTSTSAVATCAPGAHTCSATAGPPAAADPSPSATESAAAKPGCCVETSFRSKPFRTSSFEPNSAAGCYTYASAAASPTSSTQLQRTGHTAAFATAASTAGPTRLQFSPHSAPVCTCSTSNDHYH